MSAKEQIHTRFSAHLLNGTILELLGHDNEEDVKNVTLMAVTSHKDCGLDYNPTIQMVCSCVKKLACDIDDLDQSEEGLHQQK